MPTDPLAQGGGQADQFRQRFNETQSDKELAEFKSLSAPKDRVFFNGSSYSGADIKVVVHRYDVGPDEVAKDVRQAMGAYQQVVPILNRMRSNSIPTIKSLIQTFKLGGITREQYDAQFKTAWVDFARTIQGLESVITSVNYHQYVGYYLVNLTVGVQENPDSVDTELGFLIEVLENVLTSWEDILKGIDDRVRGNRFYQTKVLAELQTLSISTFREKNAVRSLGSTGVKGYTRGPRTVSGTMIFTVFDRNVLFGLLAADPSDFHANYEHTAAILDQLPPMDITITFANEYGSLSRQTIYGIEFVSEGQTMSIEDILLEDVVQYVARDVDPMTPVVDEDGRQYSEILRKYNQSEQFLRQPYNKSLSASDLLGSTYGAETGSVDTAERRFRNRSNPFFQEKTEAI